MNAHRFAVATAALSLLGAVSCGTSGTSEPRPVETLLYVSGPTGTTFTFAETADPGACGSSGIGIQSPNASHQFGTRVFQAPHLFVMENIRQPVQAVIRNTDAQQDLRVDLYLGQTPQQSNITIAPGDCRTVSSEPNVSFTPDVRGAQIQVEVCTPVNPDIDPPLGRQDLSIQCVDSTIDRGIKYFATTGDLANSNITNCILNPQGQTIPLLDACQSPSTFFIERPVDQVDAVMSVNGGQNPGNGQPEAQVRLDLYVNGVLVDSHAGVDPVVSHTL